MVDGYQILHSVERLSSSSSGDYDYPDTPLLLLESASAQQPEARQQQAAVSEEEKLEHRSARKKNGAAATTGMSAAKPAKKQPLGGDNGGDLEPLQPSSFSSSEEDSSGGGADTLTRHSAIKQARMDQVVANNPDDKIYIRGTLENCPSSIFFKTSTTKPVTEEEFAEEGIYQGLHMTDKQKKNFGILPESLYMTTNLIKKGALIESISLLDSVGEAVAVGVPEVPLPPGSPPIFPKEPFSDSPTMPVTPPPPKPPRRERGTKVMFFSK